MKKYVNLKLIVLVLFLLLVLTLTVMGASESAKVLTIGCIAPLTGPSANAGREIRAGATMAWEEVGYKIGDYDVKLVWINDESDPEKVTRKYEQAIMQDKIDISMFTWNTAVGLAVLRLVAKYEIPHFFTCNNVDAIRPMWSSDEKYQNYTCMIWGQVSQLNRGYSIVLNDAIEKGIWKPRNKKIAIYGEDTDNGRIYAKDLKNHFESTGWEVVSEDYFNYGETSFFPLLTKIKNLDATVVAGANASGPSGAAFIKQAREVNLQSFIIVSGLGYDAKWYDLTGDASDYVLDMRPILSTEKGRKFFADFEAKYGYKPGAAAAGQHYDITRFFIRMCTEILKEYGELNREVILKFTKENLWTGKMAHEDAIVVPRYRWNTESLPGPVVGEKDFSFPIIQYYKGTATAVWPDSLKTGDLQIPDEVK